MCLCSSHVGLWDSVFCNGVTQCRPCIKRTSYGAQMISLYGVLKWIQAHANGNVFSQGPIRLGVFACPHFKSDICKQNRRSDVKLHNILFFIVFKKEKMK